MFRKLFIILLAAILAIPAAASAHSLYIQAGRYQVHPGKKSPLFFCYGHHIPVDDAIRGKKLQYIKVTGPDLSVTNIPIRDGKSLHSYIVDYELPGTYVLTAATNPGFFTTWYDKKNRKRHSIKPMSAVADQASKIETSLRSNQWTKTYVVCDKPSPEFPAVAGLPLELVPARDVNTLKKGETLKLQVYSNGKPYRGEGYWDATYNGFSTEAEDMYIQRQEISNGEINLPLDVTGRWFVRFYTKTPPAKPSKDFMLEKNTATLVFEIPNKRIRPKLGNH